MLKIFYKPINSLTKLMFPVAVWWWRITKPKTFGVKVVVENAERKILLIRVTYISQAAWVFPGGKIEKRESAVEAARREVLEETGIKLESIAQIGEYFSTKWGKQDTVTVFYGRSENTTLKINNFEIKEARWYALSELPNLPPNNAKVLQMYEQYKIK